MTGMWLAASNAFLSWKRSTQSGTLKKKKIPHIFQLQGEKENLTYDFITSPEEQPLRKWIFIFFCQHAFSLWAACARWQSGLKCFCSQAKWSQSTCAGIPDRLITRRSEGENKTLRWQPLKHFCNNGLFVSTRMIKLMSHRCNETSLFVQRWIHKKSLNSQS